MTCAVCGATADRARAHCAICGHSHRPDSAREWDRTVEAEAFEDLQHTLDPDETLLAVTRGRIAGTWRRRLTLDPQVLLSPYVNLGLTAEKLILQQIQPGSGRALSDKGSSIPLKEILTLTVSDADPLEPERMARLVVQLRSGESFRLRAAGRLARSAKDMVEVWRSLTDSIRTTTARQQICPHCRRTLDRPHRFCPFCGKEQSTEGAA
jgi:RNA polymerase subunit RPABC4/transcription elongation factor Spt4